MRRATVNVTPPIESTRPRPITKTGGSVPPHGAQAEAPRAAEPWDSAGRPRIDDRVQTSAAAVVSIGAGVSLDHCTWTVALPGGDPRELSTAELLSQVRVGNITNDTLVWTQTLKDWAELGSVAELARALDPSLFTHECDDHPDAETLALSREDLFSAAALAARTEELTRPAVAAPAPVRGPEQSHRQPEQKPPDPAALSYTVWEKEVGNPRQPLPPLPPSPQHPVSAARISARPVTVPPAVAGNHLGIRPSRPQFSAETRAPESRFPAVARSGVSAPGAQSRTPFLALLGLVGVVSLLGGVLVKDTGRAWFGAKLGMAAPPFDERAAHRELTTAEARARRCFTSADTRVSGRIAIAFSHSGSAEDVSQTGTLARSPQSDCVRDAFLTSKVPSYSGVAAVVKKTFESHRGN